MRRSQLRRAIAFLVVLIAGLAAHYGGLTQYVDQALRALVSLGLIDPLPAWATDYLKRVETKLGKAYSEPAADVRGYVGSKKG